MEKYLTPARLSEIGATGNHPTASTSDLPRAAKVEDKNREKSIAQPRRESLQIKVHAESSSVAQCEQYTFENNEANRGLLHGDADIEASESDEDGEFTATDGVADLVIDSDEVSDSTPLHPSILQHIYFNGRRYHRYLHGRYPIPNDESEQNREALLHIMMMKATDGRLLYAPIGPNPQKVIDLGTGIGSWAIQFGDKYPSAEVTGLDLSPIQPAWVPPNVKFLVDDVEAEWLNGDDFDLVHLRNMIPVLKSPVNLLKQAYQ